VHVPASRARQVDTAYAQPGDKVGFADGFPLLLIGQGSLDDLAARVGRPLEMLRFRPNLVVEGTDPYAEDGWGACASAQSSSSGSSPARAARSRPSIRTAASVRTTASRCGRWRPTGAMPTTCTSVRT